MKRVITIQEPQAGLVRASCPSLPGCVVYGCTREEARREIEKAVQGYLGAMNHVVPDEIPNRLVVSGR
jgi:predicted RNase H-like HicB family nuclease